MASRKERRPRPRPFLRPKEWPFFSGDARLSPRLLPSRSFPVTSGLNSTHLFAQTEGLALGPSGTRKVRQDGTAAKVLGDGQAHATDFSWLQSLHYHPALSLSVVVCPLATFKQRHQDTAFADSGYEGGTDDLH